MEFNVSAKVNGKWWTFGRIRNNKFGNLDLSFKNTPELKKFVNEGGEWLNFALFEPREKSGSPQKATPQEAPDEVPF